MKNQTFIAVSKPISMLCGPACLHYLTNVIYRLDAPISNQLFWISDLAYHAFTQFKLDTILSCYNSNLYNDFLKTAPPYEFEGFSSLERFENSTKQKVNFKFHSISDFEHFLDDNYYIILNVSSSVFNQNPNLNSGHFVLLLDYDSTSFVIANPTSLSIEIQNIPKEHLLNSIIHFGNWTLCLKNS